MASNYPVQSTNWILGSSTTSSTLTANYGGNTYTIPTGGMEQLELYITYTVNASSGTVRDFYLQLEGGPERSDLYLFQFFERDSSIPQTNGYDDVPLWENCAVGVTYKRRVSIPIADEFVRISVKEDGSDNFGSVKVRYTASGL